MEYYIYISETKIEMLFDQLVKDKSINYEDSLVVDAKIFKKEWKTKRNLPNNLHSKLEKIISNLKMKKMIGSITSEEPYISASMKMKWSDFTDAPLTFWTYCSKPKYPFGEMAFCLAGSKHHIVGEQRKQEYKSFSLPFAITQWFTHNLDDYFEENNIRKKSTIDSSKVSEYDIANATWIAATQAEGLEGIFEFTARVLHRSYWENGFRNSETSKIVLATPLYVSFK